MVRSVVHVEVLLGKILLSVNHIVVIVVTAAGTECEQSQSKQSN